DGRDGGDTLFFRDFGAIDRPRFNNEDEVLDIASAEGQDTVFQIGRLRIVLEDYLLGDLLEDEARREDLLRFDFFVPDDPDLIL
ncbi:MAG: hypothetical protein AB3N11_02205, partial [Arenibacterium sp.]